MTRADRNRETGLWGEREAERWLRARKYRCLGRRVRVGDRDEIDLLMRDGKVLVFVEVKTRADTTFGRPSEAVDRRKRRALCRAAVRYVRGLRDPQVCFRFDVVEVVGQPGGGTPEICHIERAFDLDPRYSLP
jgi:putative endonuclease